MRRGEVWTAAGGMYASKPRPVVILQDDAFDTESVTICPLTSDPADIPLLRIAIEPTGDNGLRKPSQVMIDKITTTTRAKVAERVGVLTAEQMLQIERSLLVFLGMAR